MSKWLDKLPSLRTDADKIRELVAAPADGEQVITDRFFTLSEKIVLPERSHRMVFHGCTFVWDGPGKMGIMFDVAHLADASMYLFWYCDFTSRAFLDGILEADTIE